MKYTDGITWDWNSFKEYDRVDAYTAEGSIEGRSESKGVWVTYTACAYKTSDELEMLDGTIEIDEMGVITREEEL